LALSRLIVAFLIRVFFIAPKSAYFTNCMTMGDLMETLYDTKSKIISGILGFLTAISLAGMELSLLGVIGEKILNIPAQWTIVLGGILLAGYAAYGGVKPITVTDVFQFLVFIIGLPAMAYFILDKAGGIRTVFTNIPADRLMVTSHEKFPFFLNLFLLWSIFQQV
jgi:SSS family solute:Na+ symporter